MNSTTSAKYTFTADCKTCLARDKNIFCNLKHVELNEFNDMKSSVIYKKGQVVFSEGSHPLGLFCVYDGKIKISNSGHDGKEQIVRLARHGDVLGYRALLTSERYNSTAVVLDDSE